MGMLASDTAVIYLEDVRVPAANVIGDPGMGFSYQMIQVYPLPLNFKVQLFWGGHKNLCNLPHGFDVYLK